MPVTVVGTGAVATTGTTTQGITTPAGAIGDLVVFFTAHDDYSDGGSYTSSSGVSLTQIVPAEEPDADFRGHVFWGIENQAESRTYTFGTLSGSESIKGVCVRFAGHNASTPILAGSIVGPQVPFGLLSLAPTKGGQMLAQMAYHRNAPTNIGGSFAGWTNRASSIASLGTAGQVSLLVATKPVLTESLSNVNESLDVGSDTVFGLGFGFVIDCADSARTISGTTKDNSGTALGSCTVVLLKDSGTNQWVQIATTTSHASTGAYSFTVYDNHAKYMTVAYKAGSPNVFDVSNFTLTPV